jgi:hypothetical protein
VIGILTLIVSLVAVQADEPAQSYGFQDIIAAPAYLRSPVQQQEPQPRTGFNYTLGFLPPEMGADLLDFHRSNLEQRGWHVEERADDQLYASHESPDIGCIEIFQLRIDGTTLTGAGPMRAANYTLYRSDNCASVSSNPPIGP